MHLRSCVLATLVAAAAASAEPVPLTRDQVLLAATGHVDVLLAARTAEAARADVVAADRSPAPVLSAKAAAVDLQNGIGAGPWTRKRIDKAVGIDWTWERGDKRALRTRVAERLAAAARAEVDAARVQQQLAASAAFYDLLAAQERLAEVAELAHGASQLADLAARRVRAGDLAAQDAARAAIEAQRAGSDLQAARLEQRRAAVALLQAMGQPGAALDIRAVPEAAPPAVAGRLEDSALDDTALEAAVAARADLRAAGERLQAARAALDGAQALRRTDVTWGASIDHYPGTSDRLLELRLQIPLAWGYGFEGEVARAQAQLAQAEDALARAQLLARLELQRLRDELRGNAERARTYDEGIVPQARKVAEMAEFAYARGAMPLTDLIEARRTLRATLLDALSARSDLAKARAAWALRTAPGSDLRGPAS